MSVYIAPPRKMPISPPGTVVDGTGSMPATPTIEFVTLPQGYLIEQVDEPLGRLQALTRGSLADYLKLCTEQWFTYEEAHRRAMQVYLDMGRFQGLPERETMVRKAHQTAEAIQDLGQGVHLAVGQAHGLQGQAVSYVRMVGDGVLFRLTNVQARMFETYRKYVCQDIPPSSPYGQCP